MQGFLYLRPVYTINQLTTKIDKNDGLEVILALPAVPTLRALQPTPVGPFTSSFLSLLPFLTFPYAQALSASLTPALRMLSIRSSVYAKVPLFAYLF